MHLTMPKSHHIARSDLLALGLSLLAVLAGFLVHELVFEGLAHIEDEMAYLWQAQVMARGQISLASPAEPKSFLYPFVVDYGGQRFGKYPPGWPGVLALGEILGLRFLVNPLLGGLGVWLTYLLGKRVFGETVGLLAAGLTLTSPFFLMNSGSLLSHPLGLVLSAAFALCWLEAFASPNQKRPWLFTSGAALCLGMLILTRPYSAIAIALPFAVHGLVVLVRGPGQMRLRLLAFGVATLLLGMLLFAWQYALTGDALLNPYTLWWEYDKVGFGPGHGHRAEGHSLFQARINTEFSIEVGKYDLFGWGRYSWIFLPIGLAAMIKNWRGLLLAGVFPSLVLLYMGYWIGSSLFGPRYYYEGLYSLSLTSAVGIAWLAGWPRLPGTAFPNYAGWRRLQPLLITALVALLVATNLIFYTPLRLGNMTGLYGVQRAYQEPFTDPEMLALAPALIIVHPERKWIEYGTLLELQNPFYDTPFIFIVNRSPEHNAAAIAQFPERTVYHYYPNEPGKLYLTPR
jgi:hypothetical protein